MKILFTSDWHLDSVTAGMRRIDDLEAAVARTGQIATEQKVDLYVFLGDMADPDAGSILVRVLSVALNMANALARRNIMSVWVAGNHDTIEDGSGLTTLHPLRHVVGATVFEQPGVLMPRGVAGPAMVVLPFPTRATAYDPDDFVRREQFPNGSIVMGHCTGLDGVEVGSETRDMSRGAELVFPIEACRERKVRFMANGHFHKQQVTRGGIHIPGTLERLRFDEEANNPGVMLVEL